MLHSAKCPRSQTSFEALSMSDKIPVDLRSYRHKKGRERRREIRSDRPVSENKVRRRRV